MVKDGRIEYFGCAEILNEKTIEDIFGVTAKIFEIDGHKGVVFGG